MTPQDMAAALRALGWVCQPRRQMLLMVACIAVAWTGIGVALAGIMERNEVMAMIGGGIAFLFGRPWR